MSIRLYGETSGYIELKAPDVADDNVVDLGLVPTVDTAPADGQVLTWNASLSKWEAKDLKMKEKRIEAFTGSGTWTVPAGVTYAIAYIRGAGGGGGGRTSSTPNVGSKGGSSSVAFASGTVTANGGEGGDGTNSLFTTAGISGEANSGYGGGLIRTAGSSNHPASSGQQSGVEIVAGAAVTPAANITVTVGAGGAGGGTTTVGGAGGSGYVYIEYYEEV